MLFFRSYFFKGSETDLNKLVQKQLALNSTITILEKLQPNVKKCRENGDLDLEDLWCPEENKPTKTHSFIIIGINYE